MGVHFIRPSIHSFQPLFFSILSFSLLLSLSSLFHSLSHSSLLTDPSFNSIFYLFRSPSTLNLINRLTSSLSLSFWFIFSLVTDQDVERQHNDILHHLPFFTFHSLSLQLFEQETWMKMMRMSDKMWLCNLKSIKWGRERNIKEEKEQRDIQYFDSSSSSFYPDEEQRMDEDENEGKRRMV